MSARRLIPGSYWTARKEGHDPEMGFLFLVVAISIFRRRPVALAVQCDWSNRAPCIDAEWPTSLAYWFDDESRTQIYQEKMNNFGVFHLYYSHSRWNGRRFVAPVRAE